MILHCETLAKAISLEYFDIKILWCSHAMYFSFKFQEMRNRCLFIFNWEVCYENNREGFR